MPTNQYGVTEFDADPETAAEMIRLRKQQQIADAMVARGQQPIQGQMVGRTYVAPSITQGLAQLFNAYAGRKSTQGVDEGYKGLADRKAQETAMAIENYKRGTTGTPEQPMGPPTEQGQMGVQLAITPSPDQRRQAIIEAAVSSNPRLSKMGQMDFQADSATEARKEASEARLAQINEAEKERRITREEGDKRRAEEAATARRENAANREALLRVGVGLKQSAPVERKISNIDARSIDKSLEKSSGANGALQLLDQADELYGKYESNRAEPILGGLARVGAAVGLADPNKAKDYELADQIAKDLGVIKLGLIGGSDTERELKVAIDTSPSPDKTVGTNREIIKNQRKAIEILQSEPDFKTEWVNKHGSLSAMDKTTGDTYGKAWRKFQKEKWGGDKKPADGQIQSFANEAAAAAAGLKPNTPVIINGVKGTWQ